MTNLTVPYFKEASKVNEEKLLPAIVEMSKARQAMIFPSPIIRPEDNWIQWQKELQDTNHRITWEWSSVPDSKYNLQQLSANIPMNLRSIGFTTHEIARINRGLLTADARIARTTEGFGLDDDALAFGGGTSGDPETGITGMSDTTNNVTAVSTQLDVSTIANAHATIVAIIQELIDDATIKYQQNQYPLVLVWTPDVLAKSLSVLSTVNEIRTPYDKILEDLVKFGGPGSGIVTTRMLGATIAKADPEGKYVITDGTTNACLFPYSERFGRVITSPQEKRVYADADGIRYKIGYRILPQFFEQTAFRYSGTVALT